MGMFMNWGEEKMRWGMLMEVENILREMGLNEVNGRMVEEMIERNVLGEDGFRFEEVGGIFGLGKV